MNYRAIFVEEVAQTVIATIVSLSLAWMTQSLWSIVAGTITGALTSAAISYVLSPVRPKLEWDRDAAKEIAQFGRSVFFNTMVMALWLNLDRLLGLRFVGALGMGYYAVAWNLAAVAEGLMSRACDVYFSMLSRKPDHEAQVAWHEAVSRRVAFVIMPIMGLGIVAAPSVIGLLYDRRYAGARILFALMIARLLIRGLGQLQFQYLLASAQISIGTRAYFVALIAQVVLFLPMIRAFGVEGLAGSCLISTTLLTAVQTVALEKRGVHSLIPFFVAVGCILGGLSILFFFRMT